MEYWDIYDQDRNKTGKQIKAGSVLIKNEYRLVAHLCIFNEKDELLIQKRHKNKSIYPGKWDFSVSGNVQAHETSRDAMIRELQEELGIRLPIESLRSSLSFNFDQGFDDFYLFIHELDIKNLTLQKEELTQVMWANKKEILDMLEQDLFLPYHSSVIELLFFMKDEMKIHTK